MTSAIANNTNGGMDRYSTHHSLEKQDFQRCNNQEKWCSNNSKRKRKHETKDKTRKEEKRKEEKEKNQATFVVVVVVVVVGIVVVVVVVVVVTFGHVVWRDLRPEVLPINALEEGVVFDPRVPTAFFGPVVRGDSFGLVSHWNSAVANARKGILCNNNNTNTNTNTNNK